MTEQVSVEQCDRDAASMNCDSCTMDDMADMTNGRFDDHPLVQTFARHRLGALAQSDATLRVENERLRGALEKIEQGDVPRPVGQVYRRDGEPSKYDQCIHKQRMWEDCGNCISDFARAALADHEPAAG